MSQISQVRSNGLAVEPRLKASSNGQLSWEWLTGPLQCASTFQFDMLSNRLVSVFRYRSHSSIPPFFASFSHSCCMYSICYAQIIISLHSSLQLYNSWLYLVIWDFRWSLYPWALMQKASSAEPTWRQVQGSICSCNHTRYVWLDSSITC